jgi:PAS domain S-box-containing protein
MMSETSYRQLEAICNNARVGLLLLDEQQHCTYMNPAASELTGYTLEEVQGQPLHDIIHHSRPDGSHYPLHECPISHALPQNYQETGEEVFVHKDGHFYDVAFTASPLREGSETVGTVLELRDITKRKRAEASVRQAYSLIESIASGTKDLIAAVDTEYCFLYFNDAYRREYKALWEYDIGIGDSLIGHMARWPEEQSKAEALWRRALDGENFSITMEFGPSSEEQRVYDLRFNPIRNAEGMIVGAAHILRDVTESHEFQEALRESEERYRLIGRATNDVIRDWNLETDRLEWNRTGLSLIGSNSDDSSSTIDAWFSHIHPEDAERVVGGLQEAISQGQESWSAEYRFRKNDGSYGVFLDRCYISRDSSNTPCRVIGSMLDLTERRQAEEALRRSAEADAYRVALSDAIRPLASPVAVQAHAARVLGQHLQVSRAHYTEVSEDGEYGIVYADYHSGLPSVAGSHALSAYRPTIIDELSAGHTLVVNNTADDHRLPATARAQVAALQIGAAVVIPLIKAGRLMAMFSVHNAAPRDWTDTEIALIEETAERTWAAVERAHTEEALRSSEQRFRLLTDGIPHMVWLADNDGRFEFVNKQFTAYTGTDYKPTDAKAFVDTFVYDQDIGVTMSAWREARDSQSAFFVEQRLRSASGTYRWFSARAEPQVDKDSGEVLRWFGTMTDIHDRKVAEETLRQADRQKDEFLAMLAHELRNPLAAVRNVERILRPKLHDDSDAEHCVDILHRQTSTLCELVDDLLDVSRITRGLVELKCEHVSLSGIIDRALESVQTLMDEKQHRVTMVLPRESVPVFGDPVRLEQILVNLLTNAAKYTDAGGQITISLAVQNSQAELRVKDTGIGMTSDVIARVFTLFGQAERGLDRAQGGLGIGLTIAKNLVELHDGTIEASSEGLGKGAEFTVRLPLAEAKATAPAAAPDQPEADSRPKHVLLVEDSPDVAETMVLLLEMLGHTVIVVHDGPAALLKAEATAPDVILLDIGLPGMDGFELARRLRQMPHLQSAVMAALTGYGQPSDRVRAEAAGFDAHFVKPVDFGVLEEFINKTQ